MLRIDRHPMARHPVTPMTESDLRLHLEKQGLRNIRSAAYPVYDTPPERLDLAVERAGEGGALLFDVARPADLTSVGRAIWRRAQQRRLVAIGPSGVTQALCAHWHDIGEAGGPGAPPIAAAEGPVFVMAGSLSPVTRRQIQEATICSHRDRSGAAGARRCGYVTTAVRTVRS